MVKVISSFLEKIDADEVVLIASKSEYGQHFAVALKMLANDLNKFRVARVYFVNEEIDKHNTDQELAEKIRDEILKSIKFDGFRIVIMATESSTAMKTIWEAELQDMTGKDYIWIGFSSLSGALVLSNPTEANYMENRTVFEAEGERNEFEFGFRDFEPFQAEFGEDGEPQEASLTEASLSENQNAQIFAITPNSNIEGKGQNMTELKSRRNLDPTYSNVTLESEIHKLRQKVKKLVHDDGTTDKYLEAYIILLYCVNSENSETEVPSESPIIHCLENLPYFTKDHSTRNVDYKIKFLLEGGEEFATHAIWSDERIDKNGDLVKEKFIIKTPVDSLESFSDRTVDHATRTYKVGVVCDPPFVICKNHLEKNHGDPTDPGENHHHHFDEPPITYTGYSIDILKSIQQELNFQFEITAFQSYGGYNSKDMSWTGMMESLIHNTADVDDRDISDIALLPAVSVERQSIASFSETLNEASLAFLTTVEKIEQVKSFLEKNGRIADKGLDNKEKAGAFLKPLSWELWGAIIGSCVVIACLTSFYDKISPFGHHGSYKKC